MSSGASRPVDVLVKALSEPMAGLLRDGDVAGRYASRSEAVMATAVAAACAGWGEREWREVLEASALGEWATHRLRKGGGVRPRNGGDVSRRLTTTWCKAAEVVRRRPPTSDHFSVRAELAEIVVAADANPGVWGRAAGVTDRAVLAGLVEVAVAGATMTPSASTRQLAEAANVSAGTVWKSLQRLAAAGWVRQEAAAVGIHAATWRLLRPMTPKPTGASGGPALTREVEAVLETVPLRAAVPSARGHDVFAHTIHGGLGRVAGRIFDLLDEAQSPPSAAEAASASVPEDASSTSSTSASGGGRVGLSVQQLQALSGLHQRTVTRHLLALAAAGLACRDEGGGWVRTLVVLDDVALELGCAGVTGERRRRHAVQREAFLAWRTDYDARTGWAVQRGLYRPDQPRLPLALPVASAA